ncbi:MAG: hypothetical protein QXT06_04315 [Candidatus Bathyarchaeia archaeon]
MCVSEEDGGDPGLPGFLGLKRGSHGIRRLPRLRINSWGTAP